MSITIDFLRDLWNRLNELQEHVESHHLDDFESCDICNEFGEYAKAERRYEAAAVEYVDQLMQVAAISKAEGC